MEELKNLLEKSIQLINQTTELFYQQNIEAGYRQFDATLSILMQTMNSIFTLKQEIPIGIDENKLIEILKDAMAAMESRDTILLSDILQYDLKALFEEIISSYKH